MRLRFSVIPLNGNRRPSRAMKSGLPKTLRSPQGGMPRQAVILSDLLGNLTGKRDDRHRRHLGAVGKHLPG